MTTPVVSARFPPMRVLLVLWAVVGVGCSAAIYSLERPGLPCDRALRVTHRTLVAMGYSVNEMVPPGENGVGVVGGTKVGPAGKMVSGRVQIRCTGQGVTLQPIEGGPFSEFDFSRGFNYSFREVVQRPDQEEPAKAAGLQVLVERLDRYQSQLDLGGSPTTGETVPVRITVRNHTDRAVTIDPAGFRLTPSSGTSTNALAGDALAQAFATGAPADRVRRDLLTRTNVAARASLTRFLVFPPGQYREAQISIEDAETGESEGFVAPVE
jgi:hypothetical protein